MRNAVITVLIFCTGALAQSPLGLRYPLGLPDYAATGTAAAMGGSGAAVANEFMGTSLNPANAAMGDRAAFSALVSFDLTNISDNNLSSTVSDYAPKMLSLVIPIGRAGSMGFAMQNRYDGNLNFYARDEQTEIRDGLSMTAVNTIELQRTGGLTAWQAGWAYRFANGLALGIAYERLYYNMESREIFESMFRYSVDNAAVPFDTRVSETRSEYFASNGARFGLQIPVHEKVMLGVAAEATFYVDNNGTASFERNRSDVQAVTDSSEKSFSVNLPPAINFGASYKPDARWLFAADASITLWNAYKRDGETPINRETFGVSVGARFVPAANRLSSPYAERIAYSAGLRYSSLPSGESGAHDFGVAMGAGLPIPNDGGVIDLVLDLGRKTDSRFDGYAENTVRLMLGINGGRSWFQRETKDY